MEVRELLKQAGGAVKVAEACGLTRQAVYKWRSVPVRHVNVVESMSGVPRNHIRPDVFGR